VPSDLIALRSSTRLAFWIKWAASIVQILGYAATGFGWTPWNLSGGGRTVRSETEKKKCSQ